MPDVAQDTHAVDEPHVWGVPYSAEIHRHTRPHLAHRCRGALHRVVPRWVHMPPVHYVFIKFSWFSTNVYKFLALDLYSVPHQLCWLLWHIDIISYQTCFPWYDSSIQYSILYTSHSLLLITRLVEDRFILTHWDHRSHTRCLCYTDQDFSSKQKEVQ